MKTFSPVRLACVLFAVTLAFTGCGGDDDDSAGGGDVEQELGSNLDAPTCLPTGLVKFPAKSRLTGSTGASADGNCEVTLVFEGTEAELEKHFEDQEFTVEHPDGAPTATRIGDGGALNVTWQPAEGSKGFAVKITLTPEDAPPAPAPE